MAVIDELLKRNAVRYSEDGLIKIMPLNQFEFQTYPIVDGKEILITEDEYIGLMLRVYEFNDELTGVEPIDYSKYLAFIQTKRILMGAK